jgi:hypothetical protein
MQPAHLQTATTLAALATSAVGGDGGDVLNAADLHACTSESAKSSLSTRPRGLGAGASSSTNLDVQGGDRRWVERLQTISNILCGQHGCVWRRLVTIGFNLHASSDTHESFTSGQISDVDEGVVEGSEKVANCKSFAADRGGGGGGGGGGGFCCKQS